MKMTFSKHNGLPAEMVVLIDPNFVLWTLRTINPDERSEVDVFRDLINKFDAMPLKQKCMVDNCTNQAKQIFCFKKNLHLHFSCNKCSKLLAASGVFIQITNYRKACLEAEEKFRRNKYGIARLIFKIAVAKGLSASAWMDDLYTFFGTTEQKHQSPYSKPIKKRRNRPVIKNAYWSKASPTKS